MREAQEALLHCTPFFAAARRKPRCATPIARENGPSSIACYDDHAFLSAAPQSSAAISSSKPVDTSSVTHLSRGNGSDRVTSLRSRRPRTEAVDGPTVRGRPR